MVAGQPRARVLYRHHYRHLFVFLDNICWRFGSYFGNNGSYFGRNKCDLRMILFLLFKGVAPGGRSRAVRLELPLKPLIRKMLTHFGLRRARAAEHYSVKQRFSACQKVFTK